MIGTAHFCLVFDEQTAMESLERALAGIARERAVAMGPNGQVADEIERLGVRRRSWDEFGMAAADASLLTTRWLRDWSNAPLADGSSPKEHLCYGGSSLWWFMDSWLVESAYFPPLHAAVRLLDQCCDLLEQERPARVLSLAGDAGRNDALRRAAAAAGTPCRVGASRRPKTRGREYILRRATVAGALTRFLGRKVVFEVQDAIFHLSRRSATVRPSLLVYAGDTWQRVFDPTTGHFTHGDLHFHSVIQLLRRDFSIVHVSFIRKYALSLRAVRGKAAYHRDLGVAFKPLEAYATWSVARRWLTGYLKIRWRWRRLASSAGFWDSFSYRGVPASYLLRERLETFMGAVVLEKLLFLETGRRAVEREKPRALLVVGEASAQCRALILAAAETGIPTVGLQHGRFADHHFGFTAADAPERGPVAGVPFPDRFAVYGSAYREFLVDRAGLDARRVVVTGAPRWDAAVHARGRYDPKRTRARLGVPNDRPVVLLTTSGDAEGVMVAAEVYAALAGLAGVWLVHKLHPSERSSSLYRQQARLAGIAHITFCQDEDLLELLVLATVLVTPISTTLLDAAVAGTPIILFDRNRCDYAAMFGHHPALYDVSTREEFLSTLVRLLQASDSEQSAYRASLADLAQAYAMSQDGRAYERVAELVRKVAGTGLLGGR